jgi:serine/threonine protein kinase
MAHLGVHPHVLGLLHVMMAPPSRAVVVTDDSALRPPAAAAAAPVPSASTISLCFEFLPEGTARDALHQTSPWLGDLASVLRVVAGAARGLAHMHAHGVVHRDVKLDNLLVRAVPGEPPQLVVCDLGLARVVAGSVFPGPTAVTDAVMRGTDGYRAPEQMPPAAAAAAAPLSEKVDVFSLALCLLELLLWPLVSDPLHTSSPYSDSHSMIQALHSRILKLGQAPFVSLWSCVELVARPRWPRDLWLLLQACLMPIPDLRPTAADMASLLERISLQC